MSNDKQLTATSLVKSVLTGQDFLNGAMPLLNTSDPKDVRLVSLQRAALERIQVMPYDLQRKVVECTAASIRGTVLSCAKLGLDPDVNKGLVHFIPYGKDLRLSIDWKGYIYKIKQLDPKAVVEVGVVREGDLFKPVKSSEGDHYIHEQLNAFGSDDQIIGAYAFVKRGDGVGQLEVVSRADIDSMRGSAKQDHTWKKWFSEMAKKGALRRLCKRVFTGTLAELDAIDNAEYEIAAAPGPENDPRMSALRKREEAAGVKQGTTLNPDGSPAKENVQTGMVDVTPEVTPEPEAKEEPAPVEPGFTDLEEVDVVSEEPAPVEPEPEPLPATQEQQAVEEPIPASGEWDGRTIILNGKPVEMNWTSSGTAGKYLLQSMRQRKTKEKRRALRDENLPLINQLIQDKEMVVVSDISKLITEGE